MRISKFICFLFAVAVIMASDSRADVTFKDLAAKIDAGGTVYEMSRSPVSLMALRDEIVNFPGFIRDAYAEEYAGDQKNLQNIFNGIETLIVSSGILDVRATAQSSLLVQGSEASGEPLYRNKFYLVYDENEEAWLHKMVFAKNSDCGKFFGMLPAGTIFAAVGNCDAGPLLKVLESSELFEVNQETITVMETLKGTCGIVIWPDGETFAAAFILPAESGDVFADSSEVYQLIRPDGTVMVFENEESAEAWQNSQVLKTDLPVDLAGKAGFIYVGKSFFADLIGGIDVEKNFLQKWLDSGMPFDDEKIITAVRENNAILFEEYSHSDSVGDITVWLARILIPLFYSAGNTISLQEEMNSLGRYSNGDLMLWLLDNGNLPADENVGLLSGIFPGENGKDFIYHFTGETEEPVPVCIVAPENGWCLVVFSDCSQKYVVYDEMSGAVGVVAELHSTYPMPEKLFREWIDIAGTCDF